MITRTFVSGGLLLSGLLLGGLTACAADEERKGGAAEALEASWSVERGFAMAREPRERLAELAAPTALSQLWVVGDGLSAPFALVPDRTSLDASRSWPDVVLPGAPLADGAELAVHVLTEDGALDERSIATLIARDQPEAPYQTFYVYNTTCYNYCGEGGCWWRSCADPCPSCWINGYGTCGGYWIYYQGRTTSLLCGNSCGSCYDDPNLHYCYHKTFAVACW